MITNKDLNNEYSLFARNIKYNRERINMTQEELAEKSDISVSIWSENIHKNVRRYILTQKQKKSINIK